MSPFTGSRVSRRIVRAETAAFALVIGLLWLDEGLDFPNLLLGAPPTPFNWRESLLESAVIGALAVLVVGHTRRLFRKIRHLEGILPVCASCKKIRDEAGVWHPIESYIRERAEVEFSHGICPQCARRLYPECYPEEP